MIKIFFFLILILSYSTSIFSSEKFLKEKQLWIEQNDNVIFFYNGNDKKKKNCFFINSINTVRINIIGNCKISKIKNNYIIKLKNITYNTEDYLDKILFLPFQIKSKNMYIGKIVPKKKFAFLFGNSLKLEKKKLVNNEINIQKLFSYYTNKLQ